MNTPEHYMARALELARLGRYTVAPNPMVGCVLVHPEKGIVGEGFHARYGQAHAEVHAVQSVADPEDLKYCTAFVSLEPCAHQGKTPPCADLLIRVGIRKVVICNTDPFPEVAGKGIEKLKAAGIEVETGLLEAEGRRLNRAFFSMQESGRPWITLKWAQTQDGFVARADGSSKWISSAASRLWVHRWRAEHQAILVGSHTLCIDNPALNVRGWAGPSPVRLVWDPEGKLPPDLAVFENPDGKTWVLGGRPDLPDFVQRFPVGKGEKALEGILRLCREQRLQSLFVEGGSQVLAGFIQARCWDEALVFTGAPQFGKGLAAPQLPPSTRTSVHSLGPDVLEVWQPSKP